LRVRKSLIESRSNIMSSGHQFNGTLEWLGQREGQAFTFESFGRDSRISFEGGAVIQASATAGFHGDAARPNPETLMLASIMQCHFLTFMAVASKSGVDVQAYSDSASATLGKRDGKTCLVDMVLRPRVRLASAIDPARFRSLHDKAHANCFMANSVSFEVHVEPELEP
jgi:organic hydroperoxide reductase OsmC/OhrA